MNNIHGQESWMEGSQSFFLMLDLFSLCFHPHHIAKWRSLSLTEHMGSQQLIAAKVRSAVY